MCFVVRCSGSACQCHHQSYHDAAKLDCSHGLSRTGRLSACHQASLVLLDWRRRGILQLRWYVENENGDGNLSVRIIAMTEDVMKFCLRVSRSFCLVVWMARYGLGYPF